MSINQKHGNTLFGLTVENAKEILARHSKADLDRIVEEAKEASKHIRAREDRYFERVPDEILKKPFEIVK